MSGLSVQVDRLQEQMQRLKLARTAQELPGLLEEAAKREVSYTDFLEEVLSRELAAKQERHTAMKTSMARFPFHKSLESFDFKFQPSIDPKIVKELATGRFLADADNVLLLGPPGVGKTHLAVGLGLKACALGYRTAFTTAAGLVTGITLGPLSAIPYFLHKLGNRVALLSSENLRSLTEPILAKKLGTPTVACSARLARLIDPQRPVIGRPSETGFVGYSQKERMEYVPCYERLDDQPPELAMDHLLSSAALPLGLFRRRRVSGSFRVDGGLAANLPLGAVLPFFPTEVYIVKLRPWNHDPNQFIRQLEKEAQLSLMEDLSREVGGYLLSDPQPIYEAVDQVYGRLFRSRKVYPLPHRFVVLAPSKPLVVRQPSIDVSWRSFTPLAALLRLDVGPATPASERLASDAKSSPDTLSNEG